MMLVDKFASKAYMKSAKVGFFMNDNVRLSLGTALSKLTALGSNS
jgi:hypothetical protein